MKYWLWISIVGGALTGCGSNDPFDYVPVSGKVTYDDGTTLPIGGFRIVFTSQDAAPVGTAHPRPGIAEVDANGVFEQVTSYRYGDGLVPGKHKVAIQVSQEQGKAAIVPKEYTNPLTTPLVVDTDDAPFEIKVPKPQ